MRKQQQNQILELIMTIRKAQSAGLYGDAQEGALAISEFIKQVDGEEAPTVTLLEEYCQLLYRANNIELAMQEQITKVENSVREDLKPAKIEIVFLCYSASMSDSVFTIYQAAKADPNCEAVWLPIPYFELGSDGSIGAARFDGIECYDDTVECFDWRKYDINARHPDIIVTYAPYDEGNYVTRIHPDFFCRRLRELTDLLVYVPYYVSADTLDKHLCTVAGCVYAHKVVVQSEKIRDIYIDEFKKMFGRRFGNPEEKFIALGSPKFDAVLNTKREHILLPDTWKKLIGDVGHDPKKVVLYNTSVSAILEGNELYLKKLRQVLDTFRRREDVVLLWRPHPLSKSTFSSMRPKLLGEYEQVLEDYKREGWGIFDDSPDIHRAIAVSDAYYGDGSSVVPMYGITGKPILIQHAGRQPVDIRDYSIASEQLYDDGVSLWFAAIDFNALFRMDKNTWNPEYMGSFPGSDIHEVRITSGVTCRDNKLYFAPFNGSEFYVYDIDRQTFKTIGIPETLSVSIKSRQSFISVTAYNQYIFYIGYTFKGIVRYDCKSDEVQCYDDWVSELDQLTGERDSIYFIYVHPVNNKLYCPCIFAKAVMIFDMDTCEYEIMKLNSKAEGFRSIAYDGKSFWLASEFDDQYLVEWDGKSKGVIEHSNPATGKTGLWDVALANGEVWFLPYSSNTSFRVSSGAIKTVEEFCNMRPEKDGTEWLGHTVTDELIYLHMNSELKKSLISFNTITKELQEKQLYFDDKEYGKIVPLLERAFQLRRKYCHIWSDYLIDESIVLNLNAYLDFITNDRDTQEAHTIYDQQAESFRQITANPDGTAGVVIYNYIKELTIGQENEL